MNKMAKAFTRPEALGAIVRGVQPAWRRQNRGPAWS